MGVHWLVAYAMLRTEPLAYAYLLYWDGGLQSDGPKWGHEGASSLEDRLSVAGDGDAGAGEAGVSISA